MLVGFVTGAVSVGGVAVIRDQTRDAGRAIRSERAGTREGATSTRHVAPAPHPGFVVAPQHPDDPRREDLPNADQASRTTIEPASHQSRTAPVAMPSTPTRSAQDAPSASAIGAFAGDSAIAVEIALLDD